MLLGSLDLAAALQLRLRPEGAVDHGLAHVDELPPHPAIMDQPAIFAGIDDAHGGADQLQQVGRAAHLGQHAGMFKFPLERHHVGQGVVLHPPADGGVDAAMDRVHEVLRGEEFGHTLERLVVGQQGAQQRLFRLEILRRQAERLAEQAGRLGVDAVHDGVIATGPRPVPVRGCG